MANGIDKFLKALEEERRARRAAVQEERTAREEAHQKVLEQYEAQRKRQEEALDAQGKREEEWLKGFHAALEAQRKRQEEALEGERRARQEAIEQSSLRMDEQWSRRMEASDRRFEQRIKRVYDLWGLDSGALWETVAAPYLMSHLELSEKLAWVRPLESRIVSVNGLEHEFDLYGEAKKNGVTIVVVGEAKRQFRTGQVDLFAQKAAELDRRHRRRVIKVLFAFRAGRGVPELARRHGMRLILYKAGRAPK